MGQEVVSEADRALSLRVSVLRLGGRGLVRRLVVIGGSHLGQLAVLHLEDWSVVNRVWFVWDELRIMLRSRYMKCRKDVQVSVVVL